MQVATQRGPRTDKMRQWKGLAWEKGSNWQDAYVESDKQYMECSDVEPADVVLLVSRMASLSALVSSKSFLFRLVGNQVPA